jgi:hypothetical protein
MFSLFQKKYIPINPLIRKDLMNKYNLITNNYNFKKDTSSKLNENVNENNNGKKYHLFSNNIYNYISYKNIIFFSTTSLLTIFFIKSIKNHYLFSFKYI